LSINNHLSFVDRQAIVVMSELSQAALKEAAFRLRRGQLEGTLVGSAGLARTAQTAKELGPG
jgi:hypothetical protein